MSVESYEESYSGNMNSESTGDDQILDLFESYIKAIVSQPEQVKITNTSSSTILIMSVSVIDEDRGKIIGSGGEIINSLKKIFHALGCKHGKKVKIEIEEE